MSTPTTPDAPDETPTSALPPAPPEAAGPPPAGPPPAGPPPAGPPPGAGAPPPPGPGYPYPYPFAPRVREPWINPAKRNLVAAVAVIAALVLLGGGILLGAALGGGHGGGHRVEYRYGTGPLGRVGQPGQLPGRFGHRPGRPGLGGRVPTAVPSATASPPPTSSHS